MADNVNSPGEDPVIVRETSSRSNRSNRSSEEGGTSSLGKKADTVTGGTAGEYRTPQAQDLNGFLQRQARRVARNPCTHLWASIAISMVIAVIGMVVGQFEVSANNGGWRSRGTSIANREAQLLLVDMNREYLFEGGDAAWDDLVNNIQPGWEDDDDGAAGDARRLASKVSRADVVDSFDSEAGWKSLFGTGIQSLSADTSPRAFHPTFTSNMDRLLQDATETSSAYEGCDLALYASRNFTDETRLWPIWKVRESKTPEGSTATALDPRAIHDLCVAEEETQRHLEENGLCFGCNGGGCLPPYSVVLYARLVVPNGDAMACTELRDAWATYQADTERLWSTCVVDAIASFGPQTKDPPASCPPYFSTSMVDTEFESTGRITYTSSIFATRPDEVDELYEVESGFDRGTEFVEGVYDTQAETFVETFLDEILLRDMALAMGSAVVATIAMLIHTKSPFLTMMGLYQIAISFPLSYFVYKLIAGLDFFPFLNFIGIFVVFALGADDVFVAVDKWKNVRLEYPEATTEVVAAIALPDAAEAMLLTTLTTSVAFFATAIAPVAPIKMFAILCGLLIVFDYLMNVIVVFPALCIYDAANMRTNNRPNCCISLPPCLPCKRASGQGTDDSEEDVARPAAPRRMDDIISGAGDIDASSLSLINRIMLGYYKILHSARWPLLVISLAALGVSAYYASMLDLPLSGDVRLLSNAYEYEKNFEWRKELLFDSLEASSGSVAHMIWGVEPADTGDHFNPSSWTSLVLDDSFEPSKENAQVYLADFCDDLFEQEFATAVSSTYVCPMRRFDYWLQQQSSSDEPDDVYVQNCAGSSSLPVPQESFDACIIAWSRQVGESYVLSRDGKVEIIYFPFAIRVRFDNQYQDLLDEWRLIEDWVRPAVEGAPEGVRSGYFSSSDFWWMNTNGEMLRTAYSSAAIALGAGAAVIMFSSRSVVLTIFSTLTVGYVLASVIAMLVAIGWTLGFLESICIAILIGLSVDFVIHFSHSYATLRGDADRGTRTRFALIKMGPSILASAFTTVASAVIMVFTIFTFFQKFAIILFFTLLQATVGSFVVFLAMCDCLGPSDPTALVDGCLSKVHGKDGEAGCDKDKDDEIAAESDGRDVEDRA